MMALLLVLTAPPMCRAQVEPAHAWAWTSSSCERAIPALRELAEAAEAHNSRATFDWARRAVEDRAARCHELMFASWSPVFAADTRFASQADSWRWLADVGSRSEALEVIASNLAVDDASWIWPFAWTELTTAPCPSRASATLRRCAAFAQLRAGNWAGVLRELERGAITDPEADAALTAIALERLGRQSEAVAIVRQHPRLRRLAGHPLVNALDALASGLIDGTSWNQRLPEVDALEPGHALRELMHSPRERVPLQDELSLSLSFE